MKTSTIYYGFTAVNIILMGVLHSISSGVMSLVFLAAAEYYRRKGD